MKVKVYKNKMGGLSRVTVTVHDEKTDEGFECELPWAKLAVTKYLSPYGTVYSERSGRMIGGRTLVTPKTEEYPEGRRIRVDDLPKICMRLESDQDYGDFYLAPEGYSWR